MQINKVQRVEAEGSLNRKIFFIGEAPAATEVAVGRPFVGRAGQEQDHINSLAGIRREDARWSNVVKIRVPDDDIASYIDLSKKPNFENFIEWVEGNLSEPPKGINPDVLPFIKEILKEVDSFSGNVVVPLGNVPLWILTGKAQITKRRGSILQGRGKKIVPCVHPSMIVRSFSLIQRRLATIDLQRVLEESETPDIKLPQRNLRVYPSFNEATEYMKECMTLSRIGFDIECMKNGRNELSMSCFGIAKSPLDSMCIPLVSQGKPYFDEIQEVEILTTLAELLTNESVRKVGQNILFDSSFVYRTHGMLVSPLDDTMLAHVIRYPDLRWDKRKKGTDETSNTKGIIGLDFLTRHYTREPYYKDEGKEWAVTGGEREREFYLYNAKDACVVLEIIEKEQAKLKEQDERSWELT